MKPVAPMDGVMPLGGDIKRGKPKAGRASGER